MTGMPALPQGVGKPNGVGSAAVPGCINLTPDLTTGFSN